MSVKRKESKYEAFLSKGDDKPIGKVYRGFDSSLESICSMLEFVHSTESYVSPTYTTTVHDGYKIIDYGSHSKFITIRKSK